MFPARPLQFKHLQSTLAAELLCMLMYIIIYMFTGSNGGLGPLSRTGGVQNATPVHRFDREVIRQEFRPQL